MKKQASTESRTHPVAPDERKRRAAESAGQAGDTQGLSDVAEAASESVAELVEEGQFLEAEVVAGVENAPDADAGEIRTKQVPEDDVPPEYLDKDEPGGNQT